MKANELMIGDWVIHTYYRKECQIGAIPNPEQIYEPIPLTAEILEKNGFYKNATPNEYECNYGVFDIFYNIKHSLVRIELFGRNCYEFTIGYVHELQHALRLCRLNELADNFKI